MSNDKHDFEKLKAQFIKNTEDYMQTDEFKKEFKNLQRDNKKNEVKGIFKWLKSNVWNISTLAIGIITLIFAVLTYAKA